MTSPDHPRTPSVSELQAALLAARSGAYATGPVVSADLADSAFTAAATRASAATIGDGPGVAGDDAPVEVLPWPSPDAHGAAEDTVTPCRSDPAPASAAVAGRGAQPARRTGRDPSVPRRGTTRTHSRRDRQLQQPPAAAPPRGPGHRVWVVGCHGGAGARTVTALLPGARRPGPEWSSSGPLTTPAPTLLVCRSNYRGLTSAQEFVRAHRGNADTGVLLLGVVISGDAPGRPPLPLRRLERLLAGAVPVLGHIPWMPQWRVGADVGKVEQSDTPGWLHDLRTAVAAAVDHAHASSPAGTALVRA